LLRVRHNTEDLPGSLLITGASQLLTLRGHGPRRGNSLFNLGIIEDGALLVRDGVIAAVGTRAQVEALPEARAAEKLDLGGRVALPGFVDSHTHLIHAASRAEDCRGELRRDCAEGRRDPEFGEEAARGDVGGFEEARSGGVEKVCGVRHHDG
jgi:imidazolonepropionase-like amidohydrolase